VLVVGGAGFIGSHLVDELILAGASEVTIIDNFTLGRSENLIHINPESTPRVYHEDAEFMSALESIFARNDFEIAFNCATRTLTHSFLDPARTFSVSTNVALNLLELLRRGEFETLCHFSTSEVYGSAMFRPMTEAHPFNPTTAYAAGKLGADMAVSTYVNMFGVDAYILRPFNNYGPRQNSRSDSSGLIPHTIMRILGGGAPLVQGDGSQTRDFIYVSDTARAVLKLHEQVPAGDSVNVAFGEERSVLSVVETIASMLGHRVAPEFSTSRLSDVEAHFGCNKKMLRHIDFDFTPFEAGLLETIRWYQAQ